LLFYEIKMPFKLLSDRRSRQSPTNFIIMKNVNRIALWAGLIPVIFLSLLLLALWQWKPGAIVLAVILLVGGAGLTFGIVTNKLMSNNSYRVAVGVAISAVLLLMWINAAVGGILGDNSANMMYFGVLLIGFIGAIIARLQPPGMSRALFASGLAMLLVPAIAFILGTPAFANGVVAVFGLHAFFALLFTGSAFFFKRAGR
jgi:hypothetical protein